jgi:3-oxoacyl-[acyl-carrier protein] reductase
MKAIALDVARHNVTINNLLPERIDTDRQVFMAKAAAEREKITFEEARARQVESIAAKRLGRPEEFGAACAFLCGAQAGFISGQNLHLDGGSYPALI